MISKRDDRVLNFLIPDEKFEGLEPEDNNNDNNNDNSDDADSQQDQEDGGD